jgi:hypothetical protein
MKQQAADSGSHQAALRAVEHSPQQGSRQPADDDCAMRWVIARYMRIQSSSVKGEHHVAA